MGMTMDTGPYRIELTGLPRLAGFGGGFSIWPEKIVSKTFKSGFLWLLAILVAGLGAWTILSGAINDSSAGNTSASGTTKTEPVRLATAVTTEPVQSPTPDGVEGDPSADPMMTPANTAITPPEAITPAEMAPVDGLKIASQSWRRGGLGSKALVTFTLRNSNDYAVKDIEIFCAFARRDGSHLTDRTRVIHDIVNMRSRKTFARLHIGFVNINAERAKCSLVAASRA